MISTVSADQPYFVAPNARKRDLKITSQRLQKA